MTTWRERTHCTRRLGPKAPGAPRPGPEAPPRARAAGGGWGSRRAAHRSRRAQSALRLSSVNTSLLVEEEFAEVDARSHPSSQKSKSS